MSYPKKGLKTTYIDVLEFSGIILHRLRLIYAVKIKIYKITDEIRAKLEPALNWNDYGI